tara:strand:+ start:1424 stop:1765 length:342 start_codon:yes stop_codon:yes gene_type:complete
MDTLHNRHSPPFFTFVQSGNRDELTGRIIRQRLAKLYPDINFTSGAWKDWFKETLSEILLESDGEDDDDMVDEEVEEEEEEEVEEEEVRSKPIKKEKAKKEKVKKDTSSKKSK